LFEVFESFAFWWVLVLEIKLFRVSTLLHCEHQLHFLAVVCMRISVVAAALHDLVEIPQETAMHVHVKACIDCD
jgi:hypothetical protein